MTRTVLRGARWPGDVAWSDGRITAVGSVPAEEGDDVVRVDGDIVTAGLVNTHHHFYQWMTRGWAFDCTLFDWLITLYPVWAQLSPEDVEVASAVALGELALSGCTTAADHHYVVPGGDDSVFDAIARSARRIGIRAHIARGSMDLGRSKGGLPPDSVVEELDAILASTQSVYDRLHDGERISDHRRPVQPVQRDDGADERVGGVGPAARPPPAHASGRDARRGGELPGPFRQAPAGGARRPRLDRLGCVGRAWHPFQRRRGDHGWVRRGQGSRTARPATAGSDRA